VPVGGERRDLDQLVPVGGARRVLDDLVPVAATTTDHVLLEELQG
jgi:hypothetical protein